jgi:hypothetical protein
MILTFVGALGFPFFILWEMHVSYESKCSRLTAIAQDPQKTKYVREWVAARLNDPSFMNEVRRYPDFERIDPRTRQYIDLDWRYLGFDPGLAWIEFNIEAADRRDVDAKGVGSISLNENRSSIIIGLNGEAGLGLESFPEYIKELKGVGNDVFVDCAG